MQVKQQTTSSSPIAVDLFCGAGGLTHGLRQAGINVVLGIDVDECCRHAFEANNDPANFLARDIAEISGTELDRTMGRGRVRVLAGCAPCQTFSKYTQGLDNQNDPKWPLLGEFARLVNETQPEIVSMENVPDLQRHGVFADFIACLEDLGYWFESDPRKRIVACDDYGVPQRRQRLVLLASNLGPIGLIPKTHTGKKKRTVRDAISTLPPLRDGETHDNDPLHRSSRLSPLNKERIQHSRPGGSWSDWPKSLRAACHTVDTGKGYPSVYGRMTWDEPSPTITTQFYGYGSGRFGHPTQARGMSLREGAILQSFPSGYEFFESGSRYSLQAVGRMIGNAVPVRLGKVIGMSIMKHLERYG